MTKKREGEDEYYIWTTPLHRCLEFEHYLPWKLEREKKKARRRKREEMKSGVDALSRQRKKKRERRERM